LLLRARVHHGVVSLRSRIYVVGGVDSMGNVIDTTETYDPLINAWFTTEALPVPLHGVATAVSADRIYAIGGFRTLDLDPVDTVSRYHPTLNTWTPVAEMPSARGAAAAAAINGRIYVAGGWRDRALSDFAMYETQLDRWTVLPPMPTARERLGAAVVNGSFYAVGGFDGAPLDVLEAYDPQTNSWRTDFPPLPIPRGSVATTSLRGRLVAIGGLGGQSSTAFIVAQVDAFDPSMDAWDALPDMLTPRYASGAAPIGDRVFVPGGSAMLSPAPTTTHEALLVGEVPRPILCTGDCNANDRVSEDEILSGVRLVFTARSSSQCVLGAFDVDDDGRVVAAEIVGALRNAIDGCSVPGL